MDKTYWQGVIQQLQVEKKKCQRRILEIDDEIENIGIVQSMNREGG